MAKKKATEATSADVETTETETEVTETATVDTDVSKNQISILKKLTNALNKEFGEDTAFLNVKGEVYDNVSDYVKTDIHVIDYLLGGKGLPVGRISEIYGPPSSGKTSLAMHLLKTTIDRGGIAVMIDSEAAFSFDMAKKIGMDLTKLSYSKPKTLHQIWRQVEKTISIAKTFGGNHLFTIVVDSIAQAPSEKEVSGDIGDSEMGERARLNSKAIRKVTMDISDNKICLVLINQVRDAIGVTYGDNEMIPGGKAIDFAASVKIRVEKAKQIVDENDKQGPAIGQTVRVKVTKNKVAPPFGKAELELFFASGISRYSGLFEKMKHEKVLVKKGSYQSFRNLDGTEETFYEKDFISFMEAHPFLLDFHEWPKYKVNTEELDE